SLDSATCTTSVSTLATAPIGMLTSFRPQRWPRSRTKCVMCSSAPTTKPSTSPSEWKSAVISADGHSLGEVDGFVVGALPPDLDLALRHAVVVHAHIGVELAPERAQLVADTGVVRHREDVLDTDVPVGILGRAL